ncbi:S8 family peptidase [Mesobacillus selenatarsenatis]|uniref:Bacillopeptidase F n=1 Tax=Mesobacillus selenatarsenatis (strain DSM 18680 / JCM 14380 / FERM P-15431 / SF-1) TaxID=1321606 RepID=A0A0A8X3L1_MESS1|nr:S8 family peptidase [Mesobacillus selenatarsenatis]GAM14508.1 bacillopeptidase F [Mesobacillus selenatarsenatis SF-1]
MKRKKNRLLSVLLTTALVLPMLLQTQMNTAAANKGVSVSAKEAIQTSRQKVNKKLYDQFGEQEKVTFLVKMKEQVDTNAVAKEADKKASLKKATPAKAKSMKRSTVVSELKAKAQQTQFDVLEYLRKQEKKGIAKDVHSYYVVNGIAVTATREVMEKVAGFQEVDKILPNETRQLFVPEKSAVAVQDPAAKTNSIEWNIDRVGAPAVWDMGIDGSGITVASIDTGVQWNHPALRDQYRGYDAVTGEASHADHWFDAVAGQSAPYDDHGHGTHVTGTMVGAERDGANAIGVAPGAKWIAVKAFTAAGGTDVDLLEAGEWILAPNGNPDLAPDVVNNSWGGGAGMDEWYRPMVQAWRAAEIFPEFSAGNTTFSNPGGPGSVANPANYPESVATGATDINNNLGSFSLLGPSPYGEIKPELSAPGVNIRSSVPGGGYEGGWNGTSMAGPHVSAAVALLLQANSNLRVDELEEILMTTALPLTDNAYPESPNNGYGAGLLNVFDAVSSVVSGLGKLKGQVTKDGDDSEAPELEHSQPATVFAGMPLTLEASAVDNISVTNVELEYQLEDGTWSSVAAVRTNGDYNNGTYRADVPGEAIAGSQFNYKWKAFDFGGNETVSEHSVNVLPGITVGYQQDFENDTAGWTTYGDANSWEWGTPTSGPGSALSGEKVYGTTLAGTYQNRANMSLQMPPMDLPEGSSYLQFKQWYNLERNYDYGHVFVSTDAVNWVQKLRVNNLSNGWIDGEVDLSEYAGQRIYIAFNVTTDGSVVRDGWYLDDVRLADTPLPEQATANLGVEKDDSKASLKEPVDANKITIALPKAKKAENTSSPMALPMQAQVSVVESGRSVKTNPANGSYELTHAAGTFTVIAEAYGFRPQTQTVDIEQDGEAIANFNLEELPKGTVTGSITNKATGEPVAGATVYVVEDANIAPVSTDDSGQYSLTAYEGEYTLKVIAPHYYSQEASINIEGNIQQDFEIKPFIGYPGEIGYDDGTAENARAFYDAGNGWAVKMSLEKGNDKALVTGGLFRFWDTEWPVPGGTDFKVEVYDATGTDGAPGKKLAGPIDATALRNGEWTHVDLSSHGIVVEGDFYLVYIQAGINTASPGLATDEDGENALRSWQLVGGGWSPSPEDEGNYMIRAVVDYEVTAPTISSPVDGSFTNDGTVTVKGEAAPTTTVHIYNDGEEVATVAANDDRSYEVEVELQEGENTLTAKASTEQGVTDPSEAVTVTYDPHAPELTITSPADSSKINKETVTVTGTIADDHLDTVTVNGTAAKVEDGKYSARVMLDEGVNEIKVVANDKAGNTSEEIVTVDVKFTAPVISELKPAEDVTLKKGESVKIEFTSEEDLDATFVLHMPLTNNAQTTNATELPMRELSPGYYVGYYTATKDFVADGAVIEVKAVDSYGNETRKTADGKLFINVKKKGKK